MTTDPDLKTWSGGNWTLTINGTDYTNSFQKGVFQESLNQPVHWKVIVQGVDSSNTDVSEGNIIRLEYDGTKAFKGRIRESKVSSDFQIEMEGIGMAFDLLRRTYTNNYTGSNTDTIVSDVVGSTMNIGTNTRLNGTDGTVDFRFDEESKLTGLNRLAGNYGGEWWVDEDGSNNDQFNLDTKRGDGTVVKTFRTSGDNKNATVAEKNTSAGEGNYDGVVVKGYGDGDDQIKATAGSTGDEDEVLVYTDKTILSNTQAQEKADQLKSLRVDGDWTEIRIVPGDPNEILNVGDTVTVDSADADISSQDYRVVERNYSIDFQGELEAELVCNNRPATVFDGGMAETRQQTKSESEYMQGSRNVWGEKETSNCTDVNPLVMDFYVPQDVIDVANNNRVKNVKLNYSASGYKSQGSTESSTVESNTFTTSQRVTEATEADSTNIDELDGSDSVTIESSDINAEAHQIASIDSDTTNSSSVSITDSAADSGTASIDNTWDSYSSLTGIDTDALYHVVQVGLYNISFATTLYVAVADGEDRQTGSPAATEIFHKENITNAGVEPFKAHPSLSSNEPDWVYYTTFILPQNTQTTIQEDYYLNLKADSSGTVQYDFAVYAFDHKHLVPANAATNSSSGGVDILDPNTSTRLGLLRDDGNNFQSSAIKTTSNTGVTQGVSDSSSSTVDSASSATSNRVSSIDEELVVGTTNNVDTITIEDPSNNTNTVISSGNGQQEESDIDVSSYISEPGWYRVTVTPEGPTHMKTRVFMDHHKDST